MAWDPPASGWTTGETVTAAEMNGIRNSLLFLEEVAYVEFTSTVSITATSEGTANQVVTASAIVYENVPHLITFSSSRLVAPASQTLSLSVFDGTTSLGVIAALGATSPAQQTPYERAFRVTPSAASHTFNIKAWVNGGTGSVEAGAGGPATRVPGFIRITRVPT